MTGADRQILVNKYSLVLGIEINHKKMCLREFVW